MAFLFLYMTLAVNTLNERDLSIKLVTLLSNTAYHECLPKKTKECGTSYRRTTWLYQQVGAFQ